MGSLFREPRRHGEPPGAGTDCAPPPPRRLLLLRHCLAIQLQRRRKGPPSQPQPQDDPGTPAATDVHSEASEFWMYDSGYLLFQSFLEANLKCFWNPALREAVRGLEFRGYVHPGVLLVASPSAGDSCLDRIRNAWTRNVLKPPADHTIASIGDVEELAMVPICRGSFTPLPEALCWVVLELTSAGEAASLSAVRAALGIHFPGIKSPSEPVIYDALAGLMVDGKVYQTANGYFVVTPESKRRSTVGMVLPDSPSPKGRPASSPRGPHQSRRGGARRSSGPQSSASSVVSSASKCLHPLPLSCPETSLNGPTPTPSHRHMLMSMDEAMAKVHGEMETVRDGHVTHQAVQTNLADVICGGNPNDKVLYGRKPAAANRWSGGSSPGRQRSNSLRLFGSKRRATSASSLVGPSAGSPSPPPTAAPGQSRHRRSASLRLYPSSCASLSYSSSSSTSSSSSSATSSPLSEPNAAGASTKKVSLLSRLFRRTGSLSWKHKRNTDVNSHTSGNSFLPTFSAQFPPAEWFNPSVAHLHSVATQTRSPAATTSSSPPSPVVRSKLARSQGSLPSLSQRNSAVEQTPVPHQPSSSSSVVSSHRASTLPRPRHRHRSGSSIPSQASTDKGPTVTLVQQVNRAPLPSSSPSVITTSSRRSLASTIPPPSYRAPSSTTTLSRSPRHSETWSIKGGPSSKTTTPASSTSGGSSNGSREVNKMHMTSKLVTPAPSNGKESVLTLQVSSRSSPGSNYSLSFNGSTLPSSTPLMNYTSRLGTTTTTTMTTSTTLNSPGEKMANNESDGTVKSRTTEVSVEARQVIKSDGGGSRPSSSPVKSVVRLEGDGHHLVVLNNNIGNETTKSPEKAVNGKSAEILLDYTPKAEEELNEKQPNVSNGIPNRNFEKVQHKAIEEKIRNDKDDLMLAKVNGNGLSNGEKSPSEESVGGSSDTSVGTGPFENGITLMEFKSLAAQRILKGLSANSIDTLVEVNMAAAARKGGSGDILVSPNIGTNYDLTVHTDFGMV